MRTVTVHKLFGSQGLSNLSTLINVTMRPVSGRKIGSGTPVPSLLDLPVSLPCTSDLIQQVTLYS